MIVESRYDNGTSQGRGRSEYIWLPSDDGGAIPIGMYRNGRLYAVHTNHLGTPRLMTDEHNTPVWQWAYSAFGNNRPTGILKTRAEDGGNGANGNATTKASRPAMQINLRFAGQTDDPEVGLVHNWMREYDPRVGRYRQADPIGLEGGWNRFGYVGGIRWAGLIRRAFIRGLNSRQMCATLLVDAAATASLTTS